MSASPRFFVWLAIAAIAGVVCAGLWRLWASTNARDAEHAAMESDRALAERLLELRSRRPRALLGGRPSEDVLVVAQRVFTDAGLSAARLKDVSPEAETLAVGGAPGEPSRSQRVRLTLDAVTLPELGVVLDRWRSLAQPWVIAQIDLQHAGPERDPDGRYSVRLVAQATYLDQQPFTSQPRDHTKNRP